MRWKLTFKPGTVANSMPTRHPLQDRTYPGMIVLTGPNKSLTTGRDIRAEP
jgi:hypothetical protein